ncbi:MAG: HD-GYP domain-containing protein, partial [Anaerolineae bacterium]
LDLRVTLNVILDQVTAQLSVDAADILLLNSHTQTLEYAAGRGFRTRALQHTGLRLGEGYAGRAALKRRAVSIPNLAEAEDGLGRAPLLADEGFIVYHGVPLIAKGQIKGVLEVFHRAPVDPNPEWLDFLEALATQAAIAIDNATLFEDLQRSNVQQALAYDITLEGWARALELRDMETEGHSQRVTEMTLRLARAIGMSDEALVHVRRGALLHDIGKMGIPDAILQKPGSLDDDEWEVMRQHPLWAYEMLSSIVFLRPALEIPYCHHEKWDGSGYPRGLKEEQIPLPARIFAVADVYDALRPDRPYRQAWPEEKVREYIREQAGKHFDPQVVEVFMELHLLPPDENPAVCGPESSSLPPPGGGFSSAASTKGAGLAPNSPILHTNDLRTRPPAPILKEEQRDQRDTRSPTRGGKAI